mmetsp:Transcript_34948/g.71454  ORF Transcript_34948/g.71454 Transcript_34948/m.71454 type:complete len:203 (-) Transcript_34948:1031-1639(-)
MDTLCPRENLLTPDEEVIAVGEVLVVWIRHSVERTDSKGVLVHEEEISPILFLHYVPKLLLVFSAQIIKVSLVHPSIPQELAPLSIGDLEGWPQVLEVLKWVLLPHPLEFILASFIYPIEHGNEHITEHLQHLIIMLMDCHLQIQTCKLTQVSSCVGILGTEHWASLKYLLKARARSSHLLVKLGAHGQARRTAEVVKGEHF